MRRTSSFPIGDFRRQIRIGTSDPISFAAAEMNVFHDSIGVVANGFSNAGLTVDRADVHTLRLGCDSDELHIVQRCGQIVHCIKYQRTDSILAQRAGAGGQGFNEVPWGWS
jgi:hypothetical protein